MGKLLRFYADPKSRSPDVLKTQLIDLLNRMLIDGGLAMACKRHWHLLPSGNIFFSEMLDKDGAEAFDAIYSRMQNDYHFLLFLLNGEYSCKAYNQDELVIDDDAAEEAEQKAEAEDKPSNITYNVSVFVRPNCFADLYECAASFWNNDKFLKRKAHELVIDMDAIDDEEEEYTPTPYPS